MESPHMSPTVRSIIVHVEDRDVEGSYRRRISTGLSQLDWIIRERVKIHVQSIVLKKQYSPEHARFARILDEAKSVRASVRRHLEHGQLYLALDCLLRYHIDC
jgi:hypothetical protein